MTINKNISIIGTTSQGDKVFVEETGKKNEVFDKGEKIGVKDKASGKVKYDQATVDNALKSLGINVLVGTKLNPLREAVAYLRAAEKAAEVGDLAALQEAIGKARDFGEKTGRLHAGVLNEAHIVDLNVKALRVWADNQDRQLDEKFKRFQAKQNQIETDSRKRGLPPRVLFIETQRNEFYSQPAIRKTKESVEEARKVANELEQAGKNTGEGKQVKKWTDVVQEAMKLFEEKHREITFRRIFFPEIHRRIQMDELEERLQKDAAESKKRK